MPFVNRRFVLLSGAAGFALAACSSAPVPVDTFYRLNTDAPALKSAVKLKGMAEVSPIRGEGVVNERALLFRPSMSELQQYSYHFWADTPASMLQRDLIDALRSAGVFDAVAMPEMRLNRDYEVMGTLRKLENDMTGGGNRAVVELELGVRQVRGNKILLLKVYNAEAAAAGGMPELVSAFSAALGQIFGQFVGDLSQLGG